MTKVLVIEHEEDTAEDIVDFLNDVATAVKEGFLKGKDWEIVDDEDEPDDLDDEEFSNDE